MTRPVRPTDPGFPLKAKPMSDPRPAPAMRRPALLPGLCATLVGLAAVLAQPAAAQSRLPAASAPALVAPAAPAAAALSPATPTAASAEFIGIVYPLHDLTLSVHVAGVVERVLTRVGQRVQAGQPLLRLDARLQQIEQARRRIILNDASEQQSTEQRRAILEGLVQDATKLYEQAGTISRDELMKLKLELESTGGRGEQLRESKKREEAELQLAEREQAMRVLVAPIAGVVTMIKVHAGEWAAPGDALLRLVDDATCELRLNVSQAAARKLVVGGRVAVRVDDPTLREPLPGRVSFVSPVVDAASSLVEVRVEINNADHRIRPGVKARLRLEGQP